MASERDIADWVDRWKAKNGRRLPRPILSLVAMARSTVRERDQILGRLAEAESQRDRFANELLERHMEDWEERTDGE